MKGNKKFVTAANRDEKTRLVIAAIAAGKTEDETARDCGVSRTFIAAVKDRNGLRRRTPAFSADRPGQRKCSICQDWKPLDQFYADSGRPGGFHSQCNPCRISRLREKFNRSREADPQGWLLTTTRRTAKARGLTHSISREDIIIPRICPVLGIPLFFSPEKRTNNSPSIDRIDNSKGYERGNVIVVSFRANILRKDATSEELSKLAAFYSQFV